MLKARNLACQVETVLIAVINSVTKPLEKRSVA
jgi:hypothetical protein